MKQILNIFRKDLRRYWRESAVSVALLMVYSWNDVRGWASERDAVGYGGIRGFISYQFLLGLVTVLLPAAWAFLIVRVVQGESLVGDKQFWITRPYEWKKLLAAKVLFVVLTINVPLLIADSFLLAKAGFLPAHYVGGLLWMQLMISLTLILPVATLATVTASVVQMILSALGIVLYLIGVAALVSAIPSSNFSGPADFLELMLLIATCFAVLLWQYSRRKTVLSRCLIGGLALATVLIAVATPYRAIVDHEFPGLGPGEPPPVQLALLSAPPPKEAAVPDKEQELVFQIPLSTSGIADDSIVVLSGVMVSLEAPDGPRWNSGWKSPGISLYPDQKSTQVDFTLKKKFLERVNAVPVRARISLALTEYHDQNRREFVTPSGEFLMPDVWFCTAETSYLRRIHCRMPLRTPSSILITSDLSATTCRAIGEESRAETQEIARNWHHYSDSGPAEFGISPVKTVDFYLWAQHYSVRRTISGICPGTLLMISNPEFVRSRRMELEISSLRLSDYRLRPYGSEGDGVGFFWSVR
jgi:hypothetical protein